MQTMYGQAIAVGNLGALALKKEDIGTSRTCFEQVRSTAASCIGLQLNYFHISQNLGLHEMVIAIVNIADRRTISYATCWMGSNTNLASKIFLS